jgi:exonuclease SbcC
LEHEIAKYDTDLTRVQHDCDLLRKRGFTERELAELDAALSHEFPDLMTPTKHALEQHADAVNKGLANDRNRIKECSGKLDCLQLEERKILAQHFDQEDATTEEATKRLNRVAAAITRVNRLQDLLDFEGTGPLSDILLRLSSLQKTVEAVMRLRQQEETVREVISENAGKIDTAKATLGQLEPIQERLTMAITALEGIQTEYVDGRYVKEFFERNLQQISDLFSLIHAPREFDKIAWQHEDTARGIRAIRRRDGVACPVSNLSSGQRNALSLAIFLTLNSKVRRGPSLIMLDDPVAHVDDLNIVSFLDCLREILGGYGRQVLFATASAKTANLFQKKFDYLGADSFRRFDLSA